MPTTTPEKTVPIKAKPKTWLDWMPEGAPMPELLTSDEFLAELRDRGIELSSASFHLYRHRGILPRPIRRRLQGITQPVYPHWMLRVVEEVRRLQDKGMTLDTIATTIQPTIKMWAWSTVDLKDPVAEPQAEMDAAARAWADAKQPWVKEKISAIHITLVDDEGNTIDTPHEIPYSHSSGH